MNNLPVDRNTKNGKRIAVNALGDRDTIYKIVDTIIALTVERAKLP